MRQTTYLNAILTVNAVLLAGLVWTQIAQQPLLAQTATAQSSTGSGTGIPNAADQRQKMLEAMREIKATVEGTRKAIESGKLRVEITNWDQMRNKVEVTNIEQLKRD